MALATVRRVTAEPLPRANPPAGIVRALVGDAASEALVLAAAVPFLFLHATYQPSVSLGVGSTSIDVTLADAAIACVLVAAALRGRREGWLPLLRARVVLGLAAAFLLVCAVSLATPSLLGEDYDLTRHAISLAKFGVVRDPPPRDRAARALDRRPRPGRPGARRVERRRDLVGAAPVPRDRGGVRGEAAGPARAVLRRDPRPRRALRRGPRRRLDRVALGDGRPAGQALVGRGRSSPAGSASSSPAR